MYKINCLNKISKVGTDCFKDIYTVGTDVEAPDAIMVRSAAMHEMDFNDNLLAIARAGAGVNNIPVERCADEGIVVFNTPGANANAVKELVLAGLLLSSRNIIGGICWAQTLKGNGDQVGKMVEKGKSNFVGPEIMGKTLGVVGLGAIGRLVANAANALGMKVIGYDPFLTPELAGQINVGIKTDATLAEIYQNSDFITLHVPSTPETKGLINAETIGKCKDGVRIVNFARGDLVNTADIIKALGDGKVAAYTTDFANDELLGVEGVIAMPHLGASTPESEDNCATMAAQELMDYIERGNIKNSVNYPNLIMDMNGDVRVCILHKNDPGILSNVTTAFAGKGINIDNMQSNSKGAYSYAVVDINGDVSDDIIEAIKGIAGVIRVRTIK